jgi:RNA polymerase sigma-70 factor (ECF subfamily)
MASEIKIIQKAKQGNKGAFAKIIDKYQDQILYLAYDYLGNYEEAKDAAQETFIKVFENLQTFNQKSGFNTWLYRIAVNTCIDNLRKRKKMQEIKMEIDKTYEHDADIIDFVLDDTFYDALQTLTEKQYTAIILKYFHEKSTNEISDIMKCNIDTVRTHQYRAIQKIKNYYRQANK